MELEPDLPSTQSFPTSKTLAVLSKTQICYSSILHGEVSVQSWVVMELCTSGGLSI